MRNYKNRMMTGFFMVIFAVVLIPYIGGELMVVHAEDIALTAGESYSLSCTATPTNVTVDGMVLQEAFFKMVNYKL